MIIPSLACLPPSPLRFTRAGCNWPSVAPHLDVQEIACEVFPEEDGRDHRSGAGCCVRSLVHVVVVVIIIIVVVVVVFVVIHVRLEKFEK